MHFEADYKNPELVKTLRNLTEYELVQLLKIDKKADTARPQKKSRWATFSEDTESIPLGDYTEEDERVRREFRENFHFDRGS